VGPEDLWPATPRGNLLSTIHPFHTLLSTWHVLCVTRCTRPESATTVVEAMETTIALIPRETSRRPAASS